MTETQLHRSVAELLDTLGWLWFHPPNGGRRGKIEAARFKGLGVKPGVPDIIILERWEDIQPGGVVAEGMGMAIELKSGTGAVRPDQRVWIAELAARRWRVGICRDLFEVKAMLRLCKPLNGRQVK